MRYLLAHSEAGSDDLAEIAREAVNRVRGRGGTWTIFEQVGQLEPDEIRAADAALVQEVVTGCTS